MRNEVFKVTASSTMKRRFKELLTEDFSESALKECLALFRQLLDSSQYRLSFVWEEVSPRRKNHPYPIPPLAESYLQDFLERANTSLAADVPDEVPAGTALERDAWMAGVFLTFQTRVRLEGDSGFARDVQSLLYQFCLHILSPRLASKGLSDANAFLLHALFAHAMNAWTDRPEHQTYLLGMLYEHTGQVEEAEAQLRAAINNSSVEDHDFVTKAQAYWSLLIEAGRIDDAKALLLQTYRRAQDGSLEELQELLDETYSFEDAKQRAS